MHSASRLIPENETLDPHLCRYRATLLRKTIPEGLTNRSSEKSKLTASGISEKVPKEDLMTGKILGAVNWPGKETLIVMYFSEMGIDWVPH